MPTRRTFRPLDWRITGVNAHFRLLGLTRVNPSRSGRQCILSTYSPERLLPTIKSLTLDGETDMNQSVFVNSLKRLPIIFELEASNRSLLARRSKSSENLPKAP